MNLGLDVSKLDFSKIAPILASGYFYLAISECLLLKAKNLKFQIQGSSKHVKKNMLYLWEEWHLRTTQLLIFFHLSTLVGSIMSMNSSINFGLNACNALSNHDKLLVLMTETIKCNFLPNSGWNPIAQLHILKSCQDRSHIQEPFLQACCAKSYVVNCMTNCVLLVAWI